MEGAPKITRALRGEQCSAAHSPVIPAKAGTQTGWPPNENRNRPEDMDPRRRGNDDDVASGGSRRTDSHT